MTDLIARRLKYAREKLGLTQAELSAQLGFKDRQTLAAIEAGQRKITAEELVQAAEVLGLDLEYFTDGFRLVGEGAFSWRAHRDATPALLGSFEERAGRWIATFRRLGEIQGIKTSLLQARLSLTERSSFEEARAAAQSLVEEWGLPEQPALRLEDAIREKLGALVLYVDAPGDISGAACHMPGLNTILINRNEPEGRRHFDLAHETFHLLTWEQMQPEHQDTVEADRRGKGRQKRIEQLADNFAASLLMPERVLKPLWEARPKDEDINRWLSATATDFLVSGVALKWHLTNLGWLSKADQRGIDDARLVTKPQRPKPLLFSNQFVGRLHTALSKGQLSVRRAASLLELTIDELAALFRDYSLPVPFDL